MKSGERLEVRRGRQCRLRDRHQGAYLLECVLILPIFLTLVVCIWQVNQLKTLQVDFETAAQDLLKQMAQEMHRESPCDALGAMLSPQKHYGQQDAFIEQWRKRGIVIQKLELKKQRWISRKMTMEISYQLPKLALVKGVFMWGAENVYRFQANAYIRSPFEDREQWLAVGAFVEDIKLIDDAKAGLDKLQSMWKTWSQRDGGD